MQLIEQNGRPAVLSTDIAKVFGKRHADVLRAIQNLECSQEFNERNFASVEYKDAKGEKRPAYAISRDGFMMLAMGFTGSEAAKWREKYISLFNSMESQLKQREDLKLSRHKVLLDRLKSSDVPVGYFSVFNELADATLKLIKVGIPISDNMIMDISVGQTWSSYWKEQGYTDRVAYNHNYPEYFPQAKSNPQIAWAYPEEILGVFRRWLREEYFFSKFPKYLTGKGVQPLEHEAALKVLSMSKGV